MKSSSCSVLKSINRRFTRSNPRRNEPRNWKRPFREAYGQLASFPYSSGSFEGVFRRYILKGFSHGLFYAVEGRRAMIHAVLDLRLPREIIRQRLGLPRS